MTRALVALAVLAGVAAASAWFSDNPGRLALDWQGWRIETSVGIAVVAAALAAAGCAVMYRAWCWLRRGPRRLGATRDAERRRRGYRALSLGMVAVAAGDREESLKLARQAEALLEEPPLTLLLSAQASQLNADNTAAERYFRAMLESPELEFLGLRGLLTASLRANDHDKALAYARRAYRLRPDTEWIQTTLLELQITCGEWRRAGALLQDMGRRGAIPQHAARRRRAILLLEQARAAEASGDRRGATRLALSAHRAAPEFAPAATAAAKLFAAARKRGKGLRVLQETWGDAPHPELASTLRDICSDETADQRYTHAQELDARRPGHSEGRLALARAALDAGKLEDARAHLEALGQRSPEARACRLWAELEDAQHGPGLAAREWLLRAAHAREGPSWECTDCGKSSPEWTASCAHCRAFDSLDWRSSDAPPADAEEAASPALPGPSMHHESEPSDRDAERILSPIPSREADPGDPPLLR